jgi:hypothetical protein
MNTQYTDELESEEGAGNGSAEALREQANEAYEGTRKAILDAYERTTAAAQSGYRNAVKYGTEHPERFGLFAFAAGLGVGALLCAGAAGMSRANRTERIASPLIDAAAEVARAAFRR